MDRWNEFVDIVTTTVPTTLAGFKAKALVVKGALTLGILADYDASIGQDAEYHKKIAFALVNDLLQAGAVS